MKNIAKRSLFLFAAFMLLFSFSEAVLLQINFGNKTEAFSGPGSGTSSSRPFRITTCEQLQEIDDDLDAYYAIVNDIDCSGSASWNSGAGFSPIGKIPSGNFSGYLDGRNHTVSGLSINTPSEGYTAMFTGINNATVKNLNLDNLSITSYGHSAAIGGSVSGSSSIVNVNVEGTIDGDETYVGGLIGSFWGGTISKSSFTGTVDGQTGVGGLVGENLGGNIADSYANITVTGNSAGGIVGALGFGGNNASIIRSYAVGTVTAGGLAGGLVGYTTGNGSGLLAINNNFSVVNTGGSAAIVDYDSDAPATLSNNYFDQTVNGSDDCVATTSGVSGCTPVNTDGSDEDHFKNNDSVAPFTGWNFDDVWQITADYPTLREGTPDTINLTAPNSPGNLQAIPNDSAGVDLTWDAPEENESGTVEDYVIEYSLHDANDWIVFDEGISNVASTTVYEVIEPSTEYDFRVSAVAGDVTGDPSSIVSATTSGTDIEIDSCEELQAMNEDLDGDYILTDDIDCSESGYWNDGAGFEPIGSGPGDPFTGTLDGQGYTINGLAMARTSDSFVGLFGFIGASSISSLKMVDAYIEGGNLTGGLAGLAVESSVYQVYFDGYVEGNSTVAAGEAISTDVGVGGLVGLIEMSSIDQSSVQGTVQGLLDDTIADTANIGGLVGIMTYSSQISDSYSWASVTNNGAGYSVSEGGIVGYMLASSVEDQSTLNRVYSAGIVDDSADNTVGGLVGGSDYGNIQYSYSASFVGSPGFNQAGLVSYANELTINGTYYDVGWGGLDNCFRTTNGPVDCIEVNTEGEEDPNYFFDNNTNPPLDVWNFDDVWMTQEDADPVLQWSGAPIDTSGQISDCEDLQNMQNDLGGDYELTKDIDCSETAGWNDGAGFMPIGPDPSESFMGTLNGNGHTITGLTINQPENPFVGLFGFAPEAQIANLHLEDVNIVGGDYTGGVAGVLLYGGYLVGVSVDGNITGYSAIDFSGGLDIPVVGTGGLVGVTDSGVVSMSSFTGTVSGGLSGEEEFNNVGGLVGLMIGESYLADSYADADVFSLNENTVALGGAVGAMAMGFSEAEASVAQNIYAKGSVNGLGGNVAGGLAGMVLIGEISDSYAATNISGMEIFIGGVFGGAMEGEFSNLYLDVGRSVTDYCGEIFESGEVDCTLVNTEEDPDPSYFFNNSDNPPLNEWDFEDIWIVREEDDPILRASASDQVYDITDCEELQAIQNDPDGDYTLAHDINCFETFNWNNDGGGDTTRGFEPIEDFTGTFDGQGNSISGLYIYRPDTDNVGLFGTVQGGNISNLSIEQGDDFSFITGHDYTAMLVGSMEGGSLYNINVEGNIYTDASTAGLVVGWAACTDDNNFLSMDTISITGILETGDGNNFGTLAGAIENQSGDCIPDVHHVESTATIYGSGDGGYSVGGLAGYIYANEDANTTILRDSSFDGEISGDFYYLGGVVGAAASDGNGDLQLTRVHSSTSLEGSLEVGDTIGGLAGEAAGFVTISESYASGDISGPGNIGGLVGIMYALDNTPLIQNSYATGDVSDNDASNHYVGGLVASIDNGAVIDSYATGNVTTESSVAGGLVGRMFGYVAGSYATGDVSADPGSFNIGGLIGEVVDDSLIENNYATGDVTGGENIGGLVGQLGTGSMPNPSILASYASGSVDGNEKVGGLVGVVMGTVSNSFAVGHVTGSVENRTGGIFGLFDGMDGGNSVNNYWDVTRTGQPYCSDSYSVIGCEDVIDVHPVNTADAPNANYFINNSTNDPLDTWNFDEIWVVNEGQYPLFRVLGEETGGGSSGGSKPGSKKTTTAKTTTATTETQETKILLNDFDEYTNGQGKTFENLKVGQVIHFNVVNDAGETEGHTATVKEIGPDYVIFTIASTPFDVKVMLGETKVISIEGVDRLTITLNAITGSTVSATFRQINNDITTTGALQTGSTTATETTKPTTSTGQTFAISLIILGALVLLFGIRRHRKDTKK